VNSSPRPPSSFPEGPRKVRIGTTVFSVFETSRPYVSLEQRLEEIRARVGEMAADARRQGRPLDIAVFPENSLHGRSGPTLAERSVRLDDSLRETLGAIAREHRTWLIVCSNFLEESGAIVNAALLFDRQGAPAGIYRKFYCLPDAGGDSLEGGKQPGRELPVFDTDFGRIGILICYDMGFDDLMETYAAQGVELLLWPTMSPQTLLPRLYARRFGFHLVSATPRASAAVFDPLGEIAAQISHEGALTAEVDLDYRLVHWQPALREGAALRELFGEQVGFRYLEQEDFGIFWSNNPALPIRAMLEQAGILADPEQRALARSAREAVLSKFRE